MWREMYDRVAPKRTKTTQPGHFTSDHPSGRDQYIGSGHNVPTPPLYKAKEKKAE